MQDNDVRSSSGAAADKLRRFKAMLQIDPTNQRLARECIALALQAGDYEFVLERTGAAPADAQAQFDRAMALIGLREFNAAADLLASFLEREPQLAAARFNLAFCHFCLASYQAARPHLDSLYAAGERPPGLFRLLISTYHHLGSIEEACQIADANAEAAVSDPATAAAYALLYLDADLPEQAQRWSTHVLARQPDNIEALVVQATLNAAGSNTVTAQAQYERVLTLSPSNGRAWIGLGTLALLQNDFATAKAQLARGVESMPGHVGSRHVLAWTNLFAGDIDEAERGFRYALEQDRNFSETHGALAAIAVMRGDRSAAERGIEVALRLDPECLAAQFARSLLIGQAGHPAAARMIIRKTLAALAKRDGIVMARLIERTIERQ